MTKKRSGIILFLFFFFFFSSFSNITFIPLTNYLFLSPSFPFGTLILNFHFPSLYIFLFIAILFSASCPTPLSSSHWGMQAAKSSSCGWENWTGKGRGKWSWLAVWTHHSRGLVSFSLQLLYREVTWKRFNSRGD